METEIYKTQISSLKLAKHYIQNSKLKGIDVGLSPICDFVIWVECLGKLKLKLLSKKKLINFNFLKVLIKEILSIGKNYNYSISTSTINQNTKINIVYSYCTRKNFSKDGTFKDTYFGVNKSVYWFLISLDNFIPKKCKKVFIVYKKKNFFNIIYLIKFLLKNLLNKNSFHFCNNTTNISKIYSKFFYNQFKNYNFNLYMPYESRPHQNAIIKTSKKISYKNKIFGYYHRMPEPFQSEMIYKIKDIEKLYVCSTPQKKVFVKYYSWPSKKLKIINSIRYSKLIKKRKFIFLPFEIKNTKKLFRDLEKLLEFKQANINGFKISIHPLKKKNENHINFKRLIRNKILLKYKKNGKKLKKLDAPIIIGEPGSVATEMLESIGKVYHISNSYLDIFSEKIWPNIRVIKISNSIYEYFKKGKVKLLNTNGKKNNFKNLLKKIN